jgi:putative ABC transport system ATP-binding protein
MNRRPANIIIRSRDLRRDFVRGGVLTQALRGIDLEVRRGELLSIMGPSGSGKTTLFNAIGALDTPTGGRVLIDEVDVAQLSAYELAYLRCKKIGYIFQQYNLVQEQTCLENVTTPMIFAGLPGDEARRRGVKLLGLVGIEACCDRRPMELSGGQQQRTAIARALANEPSILLCDEPTANLDLKTGQEINDLIRGLNRDRGVTVICSTHDHRMLKISDRVVWIRDGLIERIVHRDELQIEIASIEIGGVHP